jgi:hypothetical protein
VLGNDADRYKQGHNKGSLFPLADCRSNFKGRNTKMTDNIKENNQIFVKILGLSLLVVLLLFYWQGWKGFSLQDEGFLWYGAQSVMLGDVPIRDFKAYDPGRYYWSAMLMSLFGDNGIVSLRVAVSVFQALGLFVGLLLIAKSAPSKKNINYLFLLIATITLVLWMYPRHKLFDISISIFLVGILTYLVQKPIPRHYYLVGLGVGAVAVFGRNHGIYGAAGSLGVILWLGFKRKSELSFFRGVLLWSAGVVSGYTPIVLMVIAIPGFGTAFWESISFIFERKTTNLPLPIPWPWTVQTSALSFLGSAQKLLVGTFFLGSLVFGILSILWVVIQRIREKPVPAPFVASAFLMLPYAHYSFSRADINHLAQGIFPLLIACFVLLAATRFKVKWPAAITLCSMSVLTMLPSHPGWHCRNDNKCVEVTVSGNDLKVHSSTASDIELLRKLASQYAENGRSFIATPQWPGAYPLLNQRSPMWDIYALFPRSEAFQKKEIERIKASDPGFAFVLDLARDGREELRFKNTHPLIYEYIQDNFDQILNTPKQAYQIYKAKKFPDYP